MKSLGGEARAEPLLSIQILRAAAALSVAFAHIPHIEKSVPRADYGAFGVDIFFVISGFIMMYSARHLFGRPGGSREFFLRRLARIVPLYWLISAGVIAYWLHIGEGSPHLTAAWVISTFSFIPFDHDGVPVTGIGWTLNFEMFFYAVFATTLVWSRRTSVIAISSCFAVLILIWKLASLPLPFSYWFNPIILEFIFGVLLGLAYFRNVRLSLISCLGLIALGLTFFALSSLVLYYPAPIASPDVTRPFAWGIPAALIVAGCALSARPLKSGYIVDALTLVGGASYCIYLAHPMFYEYLYVHIYALPLYALIPVSLGAITVFSLVVYMVLERPTTQCLHRLFLPPRKPAPPIESLSGT